MPSPNALIAARSCWRWSNATCLSFRSTAPANGTAITISSAISCATDWSCRRLEVPRNLHDRACRWYAENGFPTDAVRHALAARTWEEAAALISRFGADLLKRGEVITLLGWYRALPDHLVRSRARLCADYSWPLLLSGQVDEAESYLALAEQGAEKDGVLAGSIAAARAYAARIRGDGRRAVELSERALALLPADDWQARSAVATNLGIAYWYAGNLNRSEQVLGEAQEASRRSENAYAGLAAQVFLCKVEAARGRLRNATAAYRQRDTGGRRHAPGRFGPCRSGQAPVRPERPDGRSRSSPTGGRNGQAQRPAGASNRRDADISTGRAGPG